MLGRWRQWRGCKPCSACMCFPKPGGGQDIGSWRSGSPRRRLASWGGECWGEGGHGARPHQSIDAIWIAARGLVSGLQEAIRPPASTPFRPVVVSFGRIEGGQGLQL